MKGFKSLLVSTYIGRTLNLQGYFSSMKKTVEIDKSTFCLSVPAQIEMGVTLMERKHIHTI